MSALDMGYRPPGLVSAILVFCASGWGASNAPPYRRGSYSSPYGAITDLPFTEWRLQVALAHLHMAPDPSGVPAYDLASWRRLITQYPIFDERSLPDCLRF